MSGTCICGTPLAQAITGRTRKYCSDACRQDAYRERKTFYNVCLLQKSRIDLIICAGGNRAFLQVASEMGYMLGLRSGYASYGYDIQFVDSEYKHPNFERHLKTIMRHRPKYAVVPDLSDKSVSAADIERAMRQYEQIALSCQIPLIVPKLPGQIARLSTDVAIGYSIPSSYGGARYDLWELAGRRVHLLGGSPLDQMEVFRQLAGRTTVLSADGNMAMGVARNFAQYWDGGWIDHPEKGMSDKSVYLDCWRKSCENIRREWETLVELHPLVVQQSLFGGDLCTGN